MIKVLKFIGKSVLKVLMVLGNTLWVVGILAIALIVIPPLMVAGVISGIVNKIVDNVTSKKKQKYLEEIRKLRRLEVASMEQAEFNYFKRHSGNIATKEKTMVDVAEELVENINLDDFGV